MQMNSSQTETRLPQDGAEKITRDINNCNVLCESRRAPAAERPGVAVVQPAGQTRLLLQPKLVVSGR